MEPRIPSPVRSRSRVRGVAGVLVVFVTLVLGGCANPWATNYEGTALAALGDDTVVDLQPATAADVMLAKSGDGWMLLGESQFTQGTMAGDDGLDAVARSIGATRVLWHIGEPDTRAYSRTHRMPVTNTTRTTGSITDPNGRQRQVDLTSKTSRWEDHTSEGYEQVYPHSAVFFAPAR